MKFRHEMYTKAIESAERALADLNEAESAVLISTLLHEAFNWALSPQGHGYWSGVCNQLRIAKEHFEED